MHLLDVPYSVDKPYSYFIPEDLRKTIEVGKPVIVPFGAGNKKQFGVVFGLCNTDETEKLKPILEVKGDEFKLTSEMLDLCRFLKDTTFCSIGDVIKTILPQGALSDISEIYIAEKKVSEFPGQINQKALIVYNYIKSRGKISSADLKEEFGAEAISVAETLCRIGIIKKELKGKSIGKVFIKTIRLNLDLPEVHDYISGKIKLKAKKQQEAIDFLCLCEDYTATYDVMKTKNGVTNAVISALNKKKIITVEETEVFRDPYSAEVEKPDDNTLSDEQEITSGKIKELIDSGKPHGVLLYGVTGSGKTRVIMSVIDYVLSKGRSVIIMVPEISLTPQTVGLYKAFFGDKIAVIHSSLSQGERFDSWRRMKNGDAKICIGTRSAVFAPFDNIGLIVLDEEQEHTYKSDMSPKYHARDIARFRCAKHNAVMLLSSATPSIESYYKAKEGKYTLLKMTSRYGCAKLPRAIICDIRGDVPSLPIGEILNEEIIKNINKGEQTILLLNRRGYNNFITCNLCGNVVTCPHCSVSLTYHNDRKRRKSFSGAYENDIDEKRKNGSLVCHYCGYKIPVPINCRECGSDKLQFVGYGTQMVEDRLAEMYNNAKILRLDADTTSTKFAFDKLIGDFRNGKYQIMLGTQMVAKGHDFPNVTLVGIILADSSLYLDDYRANERTFALITQVIGRSGRCEKEGRAIIQTFNPENRTLQLAAAQDYESFYENEIAFRRALVFPPFCDIVQIMISSADEELLDTVTQKIAERIKELCEGEFRDIKLICFGPFEAVIYKLNDRYRMRFVIKTKLNKRTREFFATLLSEFELKAGKKVAITIDVNPNSI